MQNMLSWAISDPHFTQESELVSFSFFGFLVFVVVFLAAFFAPQLVQNASSAPICEPQLEQEPDPVCVSPGLGRRGSGLRSLSR